VRPFYATQHLLNNTSFAAIKFGHRVELVVRTGLVHPFLLVLFYAVFAFLLNPIWYAVMLDAL
jgi:hypothetical protein